MGSAALLHVHQGFNGIVCPNALMNGSVAHRHAIDTVSAHRSELERVLKDHPNVDENMISIPPASYDEFQSMVKGLDPNQLYPPFLGYPMDGKTTQVVLEDLCSHTS